MKTRAIAALITSTIGISALGAVAASANTVPPRPFAGVTQAQLEPQGEQGYQERFTPSQTQWVNATTIVNSANELHLTPYAAVIAVATSLQESTLINLHYGDRDSEGLFQQRPSCGWGSAAEVTNPTHAAKAFLNALPSDYNNMALTDAAQQVQQSGFGSAYAKWEAQAAYMVNNIANGGAR